MTIRGAGEQCHRDAVVGETLQGLEQGGTSSGVGIRSHHSVGGGHMVDRRILSTIIRISDVLLYGVANLAKIAHTLGTLRLSLRRLKCRHQQGGEHADDGDDNKEFNKGKTLGAIKSLNGCGDHWEFLAAALRLM